MLRVLLADDDRVSCRLLASLLAKWGYEVATVNDGISAMSALLQPDAPQIAILDWMMPGVDGPEVIKAVRASGTNSYIYILLLTSRGQRADVLEGMNAGADGYLRKPIDHDELRAWVRAGKRIIDLQSALMHAQNELQFAAAHDSLTGLWNRGAGFAFLEREIAGRSRAGTALGLAMADIDHFKKINDTRGHMFGDDVLKIVAQRLSSALRPIDCVARYGGEEFMIIFPGCARENLIASADRLRRAISENPIETDSGAVQVTISLGISALECFDRSLGDAESLVREADEALYLAKSNGRNRVESGCLRV